jgi:hypothetical protein
VTLATEKVRKTEENNNFMVAEEKRKQDICTV